MSGKAKVLGLIPAKGGSTRLKGKNLARLGGRSLLAWTADAALGAGVLERIVVSTEDEAVAEEATALGLEVPFMRPMELARDPAGVVDVALHALDALEAPGEKAGEAFDIIVILLPTCPFRTADDIRAAYRLFGERPEPSLMSVAPFDHTPYAAFKMDDSGLLSPVFPELFGRKSQDMPAAFRPNGAIHILDVPHFRKCRSYTAPPLVAYPMPRDRSIDIDTLEDLRTAEAVLETAADG